MYKCVYMILFVKIKFPFRQYCMPLSFNIIYNLILYLNLSTVYRVHYWNPLSIASRKKNGRVHISTYPVFNIQIIIFVEWASDVPGTGNQLVIHTGIYIIHFFSEGDPTLYENQYTILKSFVESSLDVHKVGNLNICTVISKL